VHVQMTHKGDREMWPVPYYVRFNCKVRVYRESGVSCGT